MFLFRNNKRPLFFQRTTSICKLLLPPIVALMAFQASANSDQPVQFIGDITGEEDVSAAVRVGQFVALGSDEALSKESRENRIDLFELGNDDVWTLVESKLLVVGTKKSRELDIEGLAADGTTLYAIGSHSRKRKKLDEETIPENRERLEADEIKREKTREQLIRIRLSESGQFQEPEIISLSEALKNDNVLDPFRKFASKENGIDIEGLAIRDGRLYAGFRGPVFRGNYVPIMVFDFDNPSGYELRFVRLAGRGIRAMETVEDGFLMIAGPVGDGEDGYRLVHWNGHDMVPGDDAHPDAVHAVETLQEILVPSGGKAEGLALLDETAESWEVMIVFDGVKSREHLARKISVPKQ